MGTTNHPAAALEKFKIDGIAPFQSRVDMADELIIQARSVCMMASAAVRDAEDIIAVRTFEAINTLLGLSMFLRSEDGLSC